VKFLRGLSESFGRLASRGLRQTIGRNQSKASSHSGCQATQANSHHFKETTMEFEKPKKAYAFVTTMDDYGTAFAVREDNGEQIFIRSIIAERSNIGVGDRVAVWFQTNRNEDAAERCPWFAVYAKIEDEAQIDVEEYIADKEVEDAFMDGSLDPMPELPKRDVYEEAYMFLDVNGPATTSQIAEALNMTTPNLRTYLSNMNDRRQIVRADMFTRGKNQTKASVTVWACTLDELLPEEVEL
jgi:hypothetical protein